jgi:hypothetical protein
MDWSDGFWDKMKEKYTDIDWDYKSLSNNRMTKDPHFNKTFLK